MAQNEVVRVNRWYFGGIASAMAVCVTHPLDLIKVHLQTQQKTKPLFQLVRRLYKTQGVLGFYNGFSASLARQLTYTTTRMAIYEVGKDYVTTDTFDKKVLLAGFAGIWGAAVGIPADIVNVRMQNDSKLAPEKRRNYKHIVDGLKRIVREEGWQALFRGMTMTQGRSILITIGQNAAYEQIKELLCPAFMRDGQLLYLTASALAGGFCTIISHPMDVLKTRTMNAAKGQSVQILHIFAYTAKEGAQAFYKGIVPAFARIGPHTILMFMLMEQFRIHFGKVKIPG